MAYRKLPELGQHERIAIQSDLRTEKRKADTALMTLGLACHSALVAGFTTQEVADTIGVSPSTAGRWARDAVRATKKKK